jgi:hypothetical protein
VAQSEAFARIGGWAIVERASPGLPVSQHVVGYVENHPKFSMNEPYIGRALLSFDVAAGEAINAKGQLIVLVGPPLPEGELPGELTAMEYRAELAWRLPAGTVWRRIA